MTTPPSKRMVRPGTNRGSRCERERAGRSFVRRWAAGGE